jgi:RHS repeat-associated protein
VNNFRFAGQYYDQETGLHYNYHRYYDPRTGRYLTPDPSHTIQPIETEIPYLIPLLLTVPQELAHYIYVQNNPNNLIDQLGLIWVTIDVDYHGISNWSRGILKFIGELIGKGQLVFPSDESFVGATRTITQRWDPDPDNPCEDSRYPYGTLRIFDQTYMEHMRGPNDMINNFPKLYYYQWRPYVPTPTYIKVPGAKIIDRTLYIQNLR